jgi:phosphoribosylanthranilate isomerase
MTSVAMQARRTRIKICGLTRECDVDTAVSAGVDAVGFVQYAGSPRFVSIDRAVELARRLPPFVTPVLLFVNEDVARVAACCARLAHAMLQFHGDETARYCVDATGGGARAYIRAARIPLGAAAARFDLVEYAHTFHSAHAILLDAHVDGYGGGGQTFNWSLLPPSVDCHLVLSGGLTPANVTDGILQVRPRCRTLAVDVSSGVETSKGVKDTHKIHQFVAAVRAADEYFATRLHDSLPSA